MMVLLIVILFILFRPILELLIGLGIAIFILYLIKQFSIWISQYLEKKWNDLIPEPAKQVKIWSELYFCCLIIELLAILCLFTDSLFRQNFYLISPFFNTSYLQNFKNFIFPAIGTNNSETSLGFVSTSFVGNESNISFQATSGILSLPTSNVGTTVSFENVSVIISIISIFLVYLYFFYIFSKTKYFTEKTETQEKYAATFWIAIVPILCGGFLILMFDHITGISLIPDLILFVFGIVNIILVLPIPALLRKHFYNNGINFETNEPDEYIYKYVFIDNFRKLKSSPVFSFKSDLILVLTIILAILSYIYNCNIFMFIICEYCMLMAHFWLSQLSLLPSRKMTIEFKDCENSSHRYPIRNVFIIADSENGYLIVINEFNQVMKIMKDSVFQIIYQND